MHINRRTNLGWVAIAMLAASPLRAQSGQASSPIELSLEEAVERALRTYPTVAEAEGALQSARAAQRTAFGAYLPSLSLSAATTYASSERFDPNTNTTASGAAGSYLASLQAGWDVFTGFRRGSERARTAAVSGNAAAQLAANRANTRLLVEQTFYEALRAQELVEVSQARVRRAEQGLDAASRRLAVGSATRSDVLRAKLEHNTARQTLLENQTSHRSATYALGRLAGVTAPVSPKAGPSAETELATPAETEEQVRALIGRAPSVAAAEAAARAAEAGVGSARSRYFPSVRLTGSYDLFNPQLSFNGARSSWSARLGLSFPIFDGFAREEAVERARVQERVANARLDDARRATYAEAERIVGLVALARERVALAQQAVQAAREDLRVQEDRYREGASTMLELLTSQEALVQAENNVVAARFDFQLARAQLTALAGGAR